MKLAIDLTALNDNFTGIERYALNMALALIRQGKDMEFELVFKNEIFPDFLPYESQNNVRCHILQGCKKLFFNQWRLPCFLNRLKADYYLFMAFPMPVLLCKKHVFSTIHDMGCWDCPETMKTQMVWYFRLSYLWMAKRAEKIITISEFSKKRIMEILKVPEEKIVLAYCGMSDGFLKEQNPTEEQKVHIRKKYNLPDKYILCLSTLEPRKNMQLLLQAYLELYREGKIRTKLVLAGRKGWKIERLLEEADAESDHQVRVTGFIEDTDLPTIYKMAKCFVFPSIYEGFGIPPLEAMSQQVPVISSDSSCLPEILGDGAVYFKDRDKGDLKRVLMTMENETDERLRECVENGYRRSKEYQYGNESGKIMREINSLS